MIKLPEKAKQAVASHYLPDYYYTNIPNLAFAIKSMNGGQLQYLLTELGNQYLQQNGYFEISTYVVKHEPSLMPLNFATYHISELYQYRGPLIYLDIESFNFGHKFFWKDSYFYVYDTNLWNYVNPQLKEDLKNYKGKIITRSKDHAKQLYTITGVNCNLYIEDFDIDNFRKIINERRN